MLPMPGDRTDERRWDQQPVAGCGRSIAREIRASNSIAEAGEHRPGRPASAEFQPAASGQPPCFAHDQHAAGTPPCAG
jgi:hypothetical protein